MIFFIAIGSLITFQNIWEVGSDGSACGLDDELTRELEEMERQEEEQRRLEAAATLNGVTDDTDICVVVADDDDDPMQDDLINNSRSDSGKGSTHKAPYSNGTLDGLQDLTSLYTNNSVSKDDDSDDDSGCRDIVFKDTGVINVADCDGLDDSYKVSLVLSFYASEFPVQKYCFAEGLCLLKQP